MRKPTLSWDSLETGEHKVYEFLNDVALWDAARDMASIANSATPPLGVMVWTLEQSNGHVTTVIAGHRMDGGQKEMGPEKAALAQIVNEYELRSELYTNDADLAASLALFARRGLAGAWPTGDQPNVPNEGDRHG